MLDDKMKHDKATLTAAVSQRALLHGEPGKADNSKRPWVVLEPSGPYLRPPQVYDITGMSKSLVYQLIHKGEFPPFLKPTRGVSLMPGNWLDAYLGKLADDAVEQKSNRLES